MMPEAVGGALAAPLISIDIQQLPLKQPFHTGQMVRAQVLEMLEGGRALIAIGGVQMHASAEAALAPGDVLRLEVRSTEPLVLRMQGMEYRPDDPSSALAQAARLMGLAPDAVTRAILSHMIHHERKLSRSAAEALHRTVTSLRGQGMTEETDEELLELIDALGERELSVTPAHIALAKRCMTRSEDLGALCAQLLEALESSEASALPDEVKDPIRRYLKKQKFDSARLRERVHMLGIDYERSLLTWTLGSAAEPRAGSLKAALMKLIDVLGEKQDHGALDALRGKAREIIAQIESQQFRALDPALSGDMAVEIPIEAEGGLRTLRLSVSKEKGGGVMKQGSLDDVAFRMTIDLSELGRVTASGRLSHQGFLSARLAVEDEAHARLLEEHVEHLSKSLRAASGCTPVTVNVRAGSDSSHVRKAFNASA